MKNLSTFLAFSLFTLCTMQATAATYENDIDEAQRFVLSDIFNSHSSLSDFLLLAENKQELNSGAESGDLIIPGASEAKAKEKKCVTVCDEWGRDCIINPRTGQRKCRRMCKSFGQECL